MYADIESIVYKVFGSAEWLAENIKTIPDNFPSGDSVEHIRISIIPSGYSISPGSISGVIMVSIFIEAGRGTKRAMVISDTLDTYLRVKTLADVSGSLQFQKSSLSTVGLDPDNPNLFHLSYSLPFSYFGVL
jgi:hypothetical protein